MTRLDIARYRLHNQNISATSLTEPGEVVRSLVAVQAQDYAAAKWAVAQRAKGLTDSAIDQALARGVILRTHVLRPTWHFVAPEDIRWLLALTAPRIKAQDEYWYRKLDLDDAVFKRSNAVLAKTLRGGKQLTRAELASALGQAGVLADDLLRSIHLIAHAELDGIICSGARRGKQFTYALLDERVPAAKTLAREEAQAELTRRYFTSHGPATEEDFMWWSSLTRTDVRSGLEMVKRHLVHDRIDGKTYWFATTTMPPAKKSPPTVYLLPNYDEYVVGYTDRSAIFDPSHAEKLDDRHNPLFQHTIVIDGQIAGTWKRTLRKDAVAIKTNLFTPLTKAENHAVISSAQRYGEFLELPVLIHTSAL